VRERKKESRQVVEGKKERLPEVRITGVNFLSENSQGSKDAGGPGTISFGEGKFTVFGEGRVDVR